MTEEMNKNNQLPAEEFASLDSGNRALADALKISFAILKLIMIVLVIVFLASGLFTVEKNEKAIVLRFGTVIKDTSGTVLKDPGLHWSFPYPIDEIVKIPVTSTKKLEIEDFWYYGSGQPGASLNPTRDGYCLTRNESVEGVDAEVGSDYNIVHCKWQLNWTIEDDPYAFFRNVNVRQVKPGELYLDVIAESVEPLLRNVCDSAVVGELAKYSIDEAITSAKSRIAADVEREVQAQLDALATGIRVRDMQILTITWPRQVNSAFLDSIKAGQDRNKIETEAMTYYEKTLNEAGGPSAEQILSVMLDESSTSEQKDSALESLAGEGSKMLAEANAYKTQVVKSAEANADYLAKLLPEYRLRPELVIKQLYQDKIMQVLDNVDEKVFVQGAPEGKVREFRVLINRDPTIKKDAAKDQTNTN